MTTETNEQERMQGQEVFAEMKKMELQKNDGMSKGGRLGWKMLIIGVLSVLLLIPQQLIMHLVNERYVEKPLDCKEIQPVHPRGNLS